MKYLFRIAFFAAILFAIFYTFVYFVSFSEGFRAGELIKISNKGIVFKTWEGEISQGVSEAQIFSFSIEDGNTEVIEKLKELQGTQVKLTYKERYATFPWLGDTKYYVTNIQETSNTLEE